MNRQLIQSFETGKVFLEEVPTPSIGPKTVLISSTISLVSLGTEKMLLDFGKSNLIGKALKQPERAKQSFNKLRTDGLSSTINTIRNKLQQTTPLGYSNVGKVIATGKEVTSISVGDRVVSNGPHADFVAVQENLCAKVPDTVSDEAAAFTVVGAIALQAIRLVTPGFGEVVVVMGLGLIGQICVQLLAASSCRVIGFDIDNRKVELARGIGIECYDVNNLDPVEKVKELTGKTGSDAVIITASSDSNHIVSQSARMSRKRGKIVLVGIVGLNLSRHDFYEKELSFQVSCSYGPGRYDPEYEEKGHDYPIGFVRWTEQRNFEAILSALEKGQLIVEGLITNKCDFSQFKSVYDNLSTDSQIASLFQYRGQTTPSPKIVLANEKNLASGHIRVGIIGAGNFCKSVVTPLLKSLNYEVTAVASLSGLSATEIAKKLDANIATSNYKAIIENSSINLVMIMTRHSLHSDMVIEALQSGKHVFVEKPLCLDLNELVEIEKTKNEHDKQLLMVGQNRRFSSLAKKLRQDIGDSKVSLILTINAGALPGSSWVRNTEESGGRIIGEICHFVDLSCYLTSSSIKRVCANSLGNSPASEDVSLVMSFSNGSQATINYLTNGNHSYPKEHIEAFYRGRITKIENWKVLRSWGGKSSRLIRQDKGHRAQFQLLKKLLEENGTVPVPFSEYSNIVKATLGCVQSLRENKWIDLRD